MPTSHLSFIDWLIILIYFLFVLGIGFYVKKHTQSANDFFMAGRKNSSWVAGLAFLSANLGALELLGMAGQSYQYGILTAHFYLIGAIPAMLFLGLYMMPFYYHSGIYSVPSYLKFRYNESTRTLNAIAFAIMTLLVSGINLYAMALVLHIFLGWNISACMWISALTVAIYVALGGLTSAIFSEVVQFFLIWGGLFLAVILGVIETGGWHAVAERIPSGFVHLWANTGSAHNNPMFIDWFGMAMGLGFVLAFGYWTTDFLVVQRAFSAKDLRTAQLTPILASFFKMAVPLIVVTAGLIVLALVKLHNIDALERPDEALLVLIERYYPPGLLGLGITALLAGFMSGQAGNISAFNTVFTYDIYRAHWVQNGSDTHYVWIGRLATLAGMFISIMTAYWAMDMPTIMEYMQALFSIVNAPLFATILLGMFWKRANGTGAFWGLLIGMVVSAVMFLLVKFNLMSAADFTISAVASPMAADFWRAIWAWVITFVLTIIISLLTAPQPLDSIKGLVLGAPREVVTEALPWHKKPAVWAGISFIVLIVLNVVFW
ncbi:MAG TPA: sodium:solute symporter family protein [Gammaproteobacteria bacterium]|nr:sodium:solute symporter family protein [Gammaproteobacteria bacterium]